MGLLENDSALRSNGQPRLGSYTIALIIATYIAAAGFAVLDILIDRGYFPTLPHTIIVASGFLLLVTVGVIGFWLNRQRSSTLKVLIKSNTSLSAASHQILASEQQLKATNQQLRASEQQLKASNQQLRASEQQLKAANQQLYATGQQLRASNQQLKASEESLRTSEERYARLAEAAFEGIAISKEGIIIDANPQLARMMGVSAHELIGKEVNVFVAPEHRGMVAEHLRSGSIEPYEHLAQRKDGSTFPVEIRAGQAQPQSSIERTTVIRDISERVAFEKRLRENESMLIQAQRLAQVGHYSFDIRAGRWTSSEMLDTILGLPADYEKTVEGWISIIHPGQQKEMSDYLTNHILRDHNIFDKEYRTVRKVDGVTRWVHGMGNLIFDETGSPITMFGTIQDITERKQLLEEVQKSQKLDSLGILAGGIAHDFNNLMGGLFGYIDLARGLCGDNDRIAGYLDRALGSFRRAKDLTQHLLTFAKGGSPSKESLLIMPIVKEAVEMALSGSTVKCRYDVKTPNASAAVDATQITQVINNIALNARQAMASGGDVAISIGTREIEDPKGIPILKGAYVEICISDHGAGIAPEHIAKIFDPFFTTKQQGSGLGLAISYSIIKKHGGQITVASTPGKGATFCILLPATSKGTNAGAQNLPAAVRGHGRVLVMDDEEVIRRLATDVLTGLGYEVDTADHGAAAIDCFEKARQAKRPYDVVILDLTVPGGMGGIEALSQLLKIDSKVRAIVSSGYSDDSAMKNPAVHGFAATVAKPYRANELAAVLSEVLTRK